jgi:hypothetical protein
LPASHASMGSTRNVCADGSPSSRFCGVLEHAVEKGVINTYYLKGGVANGTPLRCKCSKIMSPHNCNETLSPSKDGDDESERVPTSESD